MCRFRYDVRTAARMIRDRVNEPRARFDYQTMRNVTVPRERGDRITLADATAYCKDVRDNHERMESWRRENPDEPYPIGICRWDRSHGRRLFTRPDGTTYCRMVKVEHELRVNVPIAA